MVLASLLVIAIIIAFVWRNWPAIARTTTEEQASKIVESSDPSLPVSVNYHFTRQCNKSCRFCFFTELTSHREDLDQAKKGLMLLRQAGMKKLNFAGGEPFLEKKFLGALVKYCKVDLALESVSIVSNGSLIDEKWLISYGSYVDILAVSCDSFNEATNIAIGRGSGDNVRKLYQIRDWCDKYGIKFKINTVVCQLNKNEDMNEYISDLRPFRWKCFQVLMVEGENSSEDTLRDVRELMITDAEYETFCQKHANQPAFIPESNKVMAKSYLILDEYMRFLSRDGNEPSQSILDVGVKQALSQVFWDKESFDERGGVYDWTRERAVDCGSSDAAGIRSRLEW